LCDFLDVFVERERSAGLLPPQLLQQLQEVPPSCCAFSHETRHSLLLQHSEQYSLRFVQSPGSCCFLPSEIAAAAWRESVSLWGVTAGRSVDLAAALIMKRNTLAPVLASAMAAAKVELLACYCATDV
jgi:hypothetical protein